MKAIRPLDRAAGRLPVLVQCALTAVLASCAAPPPPPAPPAPVQAAPPAPAPASPADWRDAPRTPGDWRWALSAGKSQATYGKTPAAPLASLTCDRARGEVLLARVAAPQDNGDPVPLALVTTSTTRALLSQPAADTPGWLVATFQPGDPILDAIAFSRGRFAFEAAGLPTLYLPSWPEVSRVIEDCR